MSTRPLVNITMPACNRRESTRQAIEALARHTAPDAYHLTVVDNASTDGARELLQDLHARGLVHSLYLPERNMGVSCAVNTGWQALAADYYMKLDNDVLVRRSGWLEELVAVAEALPELGMLAYPAQRYPKFEPLRLQGGRTLLLVPFCGGQCVLVPRRVFERLGYWCEDYGLYGEEDSDYGARIACAKLASAVLPDEDAVACLEDDPNTPYRTVKSRAARRRNIEQYLTNTWAYRTGLRPLYMPRKYTQEVQGHAVRYGLDRNYQRRSAAWNAHRKSVAAANTDWIEAYIAGREAL